MTLKTIYDIVDCVAPFALSGEYCAQYGAYDNSGILLDTGREITSVLFSLDLSAATAARAKECGAELVITHHPVIYQPLKSLAAGEPVTECAGAGISLLSAHFNLDFSEGGIDDSLASLFGKRCSPRMHALSRGGYGGVTLTEREMTVEELLSFLKEKLPARRVTAYGDRPVRKIATFCGGGMDEESIRFAFGSGADTYLSSDPKHHLIALALGLGLNVILPTHYASENYGFEIFYRKIKEKLSGVRTSYFTDERYL